MRRVAETVTKAPPAPPEAPRGRKLSGNLGHGSLNPGVGKRVQRSGRPEYCGTMHGRAFDVTEHPNSKDPNRMSLRFAGECVAIDAKGNVLHAAEWYLPPVASRAIKAGLKSGGPVTFALEIWCQPDEEGRPASPLGYSYATYNRTPETENDPVMAIAYAAGILERPAPAQLAIEDEREEPEIDPETGEVIAAQASAA